MAGLYSTPSPRVPLTLGQWLRKARMSKRLPIREIAAILGFDQSHLGKYERDARTLTMAQADSFAKAYQVPIHELKQRILIRKLIDECEGDITLAEEALSHVSEDAAAYRVNNPANNSAVPPLTKPPPGPL